MMKSAAVLGGTGVAGTAAAAARSAPSSSVKNNPLTKKPPTTVTPPIELTEQTPAQSFDEAVNTLMEYRDSHCYRHGPVHSLYDTLEYIKKVNGAQLEAEMAEAVKEKNPEQHITEINQRAKQRMAAVSELAGTIAHFQNTWKESYPGVKWSQQFIAKHPELYPLLTGTMVPETFTPPGLLSGASPLFLTD